MKETVSSAANGRIPGRYKTHRNAGRPPFDCVALLLQGGGALGAYQGGVYQALAEAGLHPDWVAGISIGAINAAIIAGNPPERRVERLRAFWELVTGHPAGNWVDGFAAAVMRGDRARSTFGQIAATHALVHGAADFFAPRWPNPWLHAPGTVEATSYYDTSPLRATLERLVDFDRINASGQMRFSVGAVNVRTGNFAYFNARTHRIGPEHIMASGALPPGFAAVEIDGEHYWDGGLVSNTPLEYLLEAAPRLDTLVMQVDLWSARGTLPNTMADVLERTKDIQYSSRTRLGTDVVAARQKLRNALTDLLQRADRDKLPPALLADLEPWLCDRVFNIVHLIYRAKPYEEQYKDYAFGATTMREHWASGLGDMQRTLQRPEFFVRPARGVGVVTHDIHRAKH